MKKFLPILILSFLLAPFAQYLFEPMENNAATVTTGVTFTTNQTVQYYHLNDAVNNATVSDIVSGDITDGTIAAVDLGANSVTTAKILDATIATGDIANRTIIAGNIATNTLTETELFTNLNFRSGTLTFSNMVTLVFSNGQIASTAVAAISNTVGTANANTIVKTGPLGTIDRSLMVGGSSILSSNLATATGHASANTFTNIASLTTTATNGMVIITARAISSTGGGMQYIRIRDADTNAVEVSSNTIGTGNPALQCTLIDSLSGATKTYFLDVSSSAGSQVYTNANATPPIVNGLGLKVIQLP
jgi:hypothetical protein